MYGQLANQSVAEKASQAKPAAVPILYLEKPKMFQPSGPIKRCSKPKLSEEEQAAADADLLMRIRIIREAREAKERDSRDSRESRKSRELRQAAFARLGNPPLTGIRDAYLKLARGVHPDKNDNTPEATKAFQDLNSAYGIIKQYMEKPKGGSKRRKYRKTRRHTKRHRKTTHS